MAIDFGGAAYYEAATTLGISAFPFAFSCWYEPDTTGVTQGLCGLFSGPSSGDTNRWHMLTLRSTNTISAYSRNGGTNAHGESGSTLSANNWYHCLAVFNSATSRLVYLDGVAGTENTTSVTYSANTDTCSIGRYGDDTPGANVNGQLSDICVWSGTVPTADEAVALAAGVAPVRVRPGELVGWYPLDNTTMGGADVVGGYDLTVGGTPTNATVWPPIRRSGIKMVVPGTAAAAGQSPMIITPWRREPAHLLRL